MPCPVPISTVAGARSQPVKLAPYRAPVMARLLAVPSLTGFASMLSGTGLPFTTLRGDLNYTGSRLTLDRMLAFGEALGVTADGWIDLDRDVMQLQGTVALHAVCQSVVVHTWPPIALQVCSASMGVTLNHGILPCTEQEGVLSSVTFAGATGMPAGQLVQ